MKKLTIIIVNWNSREMLRHCLESISLADKDSFELSHIFVVDNASADGSADNLKLLNLPLKIIQNCENRGFAAACNQVARESSADYLLFLNPDTVLFKNSLSVPLKFLDKVKNSEIGIVGIQLVDENRRISRTCVRFPTPGMFFAKLTGFDRLFPRFFSSYFMTEWDHDNSQEVDHVIGAFYLVRQRLFETLGGLDERFFVYLEDLDFSFRARCSGWKSFYITEAQAYHKGGGTSEQVKATRLFYSLRSRILYGFKHFNKLAATGLLFGTLFIEPFSRLSLAFFRFSGSQLMETIKGFYMLWMAAPELFSKISKCD